MTLHSDDGVASLPTVREVLDLAEVVAGDPELIAGGSGVDRDVRWAHVAAGRGVAELLDGGELILTTGAGWPSDPAELRAIAEGLATAGGVGVAAVLLELGRGFSAAPPELVETCEAHGVPLVVLRREVRFVHITQRVHQRILAAQNEALVARAEVHTMLTELGLNRSPVDYVIERLADALDAPVVLEDSAHRVIALAAHGADPERALDPWVRADGRVPEPPPGAPWVRVGVEARGRRFGTLTALPGPAHPAGRRTVLELGAFALALGRLADPEGDEWLRLGSKRLFAAVLAGRYRNDAELRAQLAAAGLLIEGRTLVAATLRPAAAPGTRGKADFGGHASLERATLETALRRAVAPEGRALIALDDEADGTTLLALLSFSADDARTGTGANTPPLAARLAHELDMLVPATTSPAWRTHLALGSPSTRLPEVVASLEEVRAAGRLGVTAEIGRVTVQQAERQPLAHLVRALAGAPELQRFAAETLAPLTSSPEGPELLRVLAAIVAHPTNRSRAAKEARLSRSVFYQRLALIEERLGVDLTDGETIATLTVALLARER